MTEEQTLYEARLVRKTRSDKGRRLITTRDVITLTWIGEQLSVRFDQLEPLLARLRGREGHNQNALSRRTVEGIVERWKHNGLVETEKFVFREPAWVWLSRKGLSFVGLPFSYYRTNITTLKHLYAVNQVRLFVEAHKGGAVLWKSERALRREQSNPQTHIVDAEGEIAGTVVGIEVELTQKEQSRIKAILVQLAERYETVWYFTTNQTKDAVQNALRQLIADDAIIHDRFEFYSLTDM